MLASLLSCDVCCISPLDCIDKLARGMITRYGMSDCGTVALKTVTNQYMGGDTSLACFAEMSALIDKKGIEIVGEQHDKANKLLNDHMDKLHGFADFLYERETITGEE